MADNTKSMRVFLILWAGQLVSLLGTGMTRFALAIWVWEQTGTATAMVLIGISATLPALVAKLVAGPLVDRWPRQRVLVVSDLLAGLCTLGIWLLWVSDQLQVWQLYLATAITGCVGVFQGLALAVTITVLLPKSEYGRANGLRSLADYAAMVGAPLLGGLLLRVGGLATVLLIDLVTFLLAVSALLVIRIPQAPPQAAENAPPFWRELGVGFRYIWARPSLVRLLLIVALFHLAESLGFPLIAPLILARTGNEVALGTVQMMQGIGGVVGGLWISSWGGPKRQIHGVLLGIVLTGLLGDALMGLGQSLPVWVVAAFLIEAFIPLTLSSYHALWQSKIPVALQGRVFAARNLVAHLGEPLAMLTSGLLIDQVLGPALQPTGRLTPLLGGFLGTGLAAAMSLLLICCGLLTALAGLSGYALRSVRQVETILPDQPN